MRWTPDQLASLVAIVDRGTFDAAAHALQITPSAVSQRVRALESAVGQVLVRRTVPATPTQAGRIMLTLARQIEHLNAAAHTQLTGPSDRADPLPVAVNADSLATWFTSVLRDAATWPDSALRLAVEDQAHSAELLRNGDVIAAVTSESSPVAGCRVHKLGSLRYLAAATPELRRQWQTSSASFDWANAPMVNFNAKDTLQFDHLERHGVTQMPLVHQVPSSNEFVVAVTLGLGWAMIPERQLHPRLAAGELVVIDDHHVDVPLFWQHWRLDTPALQRLSQSVFANAVDELRHA